MRYIPILEADEKPDDKWLKKAEELTKTLEKEPDAEKRKRIIKNNKAHWSKLREWLLKYSAGKCWYSEAKDCVQYWEVEHFRPKNATKDEDGKEIHEGYWWLAFDWHNYRIAGQVINRKKGAYFPLRDGSFIADAPGKPHDDESPCLLDPLEENDCLLVFFEVNGEVVPKPGADAWERHRVEISSERYNLNCDTLVFARRALWQTCWASINEYLNLMKEHCKTGSASKKGEARQVLKRLRSYVRSDAPFSMVAASCIVAANQPDLTRAVLTGR